MKYLGYCSLRYGADRMANHTASIWPLLKHEILSAPAESVLSFSAESLDGLEISNNQIVVEALSVLQKVLMQNSTPYLNLILKDDDINFVMDNISSYKSYTEISTEEKQKLHGVGCILVVCAKTCITSCNQAFERFFPHVLDALGLCSSSGNHSLVGDYRVAEKIDFGALFFSVILLEASRDLILDSKLPSQSFSASDAYWCMLQSFSVSLAKVFSSILRRANYQETLHSDIYLGGKTFSFFLY